MSGEMEEVEEPQDGEGAKDDAYGEGSGKYCEGFDGDASKPEELKQLLHEQKLALNREIALREDATLEVERLMHDLRESEKRLETLKISQGDDIRALRDKIIWLTNENETQKLEFEAKVSELEESLRKCKASPTVSTNSSEHDNLLKEVITLKDELHKYQEMYPQISEEVEFLKGQQSSYEQRLKDAARMYEETRASLDIKKGELIEALETVRELQDEKALMGAELDILKAGEVGNVERGNSLFKEVEDKRRKLAMAYQTLKNKYLAVENIVAKKNQEISSLKAQIISLKKYDLNVEDQTRKINGKYLESCEKRIQDLEAINCMLEKRKESPEIVTISDNPSQFQWIHVIIDEARAEARKTIVECQKISSNSIMTASSLRKAEMENKDLKIEIMRKSSLIDELEQRIADLQTEMKENVASRCNKPDDSVLTSKSSNKTVRFADAGLEETCLENQ